VGLLRQQHRAVDLLDDVGYERPPDETGEESPLRRADEQRVVFSRVADSRLDVGVADDPIRVRKVASVGPLREERLGFIARLVVELGRNRWL
jgi:hypothetical protein